MVESREPSKIRALVVRMSGGQARPVPGGWNFQVHLRWKLQNSFPRGNVAAGERTLYSTGCSGC